MFQVMILLVDAKCYIWYAWYAWYLFMLFVMFNVQYISDWWLNHPSQKYESNWITSPNRGENSKNVWNHQPRFPWNKGSHFPSKTLPFGGNRSCFRSRANLTRFHHRCLMYLCRSAPYDGLYSGFLLYLVGLVRIKIFFSREVITITNRWTMARIKDTNFWKVTIHFIWSQQIWGIEFKWSLYFAP